MVYSENEIDPVTRTYPVLTLSGRKTINVNILWCCYSSMYMYLYATGKLGSKRQQASDISDGPY